MSIHVQQKISEKIPTSNTVLVKNSFGEMTPLNQPWTRNEKPRVRELEGRVEQQATTSNPEAEILEDNREVYKKKKHKMKAKKAWGFLLNWGNVLKKALCLNQSAPHSISQQLDLNTMRVKILPALKDNYMYLLVDPDTKEAAIIDPVEPDKVLHAVKEEGANLTTVLTTHHHWDHAGGNEELMKKKPGLQVIGGDERIAGMTQRIKHLDKIKIGNLDIQCLFTPCHTSGHFCYYVSKDTSTDGAVFTGDTLFVGGCGRFFEGNSEEMFRALYDILGNLPGDTKVFCGHEYAYQNLRFAEVVEKNNQNVQNKIAWVVRQREQGMPTVPSTIAEEKSYNPFMRVTEDSVMRYANSSDEIEVMTIIRREKDNFRI